MKSRKEKTAQAYKLHVAERGPTPDSTGQGSGRPVIMLHGIVSTHRYWASVTELLQKERHLYLPDLLGFGDSPAPRQGLYTLEQYIVSLDRTFENYKFREPPVLVGHSMGALIALHWAALYPERFSGLVLVSPVFIDESRLHQQVASLALEGRYLAHRFLARIVTLLIGLAGLLPTRLATWLNRKWPKHVIEDATRHRYHVFRKILKNKHFTEHVLDDLARVNLSLRILIGEHDPMSHHALSDVEKVCSPKKDCHIQSLDAGHHVPLEEPEIVANTILSV